MNNGEQLADLHIHTYYSDGIYSPEDIVKKALKHGLSAIAITDHDTVDGCAEAQRIAAQHKIECLSGVEFSTFYEGREIHVIGYCMDIENKQLLDTLKEFKAQREKRAREIQFKLEKIGIDIPFAAIQEKAGNAPISRPHIAAALVDLGYVSSFKDAFYKYIGENGPAYSDKTQFHVEKAIELINKTGGVAVLAHPANYFDNKMLYKIIKFGIDGIETVHPMHNEAMRKHYSKIASQYWLLETGGSDYHGSRDYDDYNFGKFVVPLSSVESIKYHTQLR